MKNLLIKIIESYQAFFSIFIKSMLGIKSSCRFSPTCSEYAKVSISKHGVLKGGKLSAIRILKCQPFYKGN
jgi:putative membrane protein insertion efficiency factor